MRQRPLSWEGERDSTTREAANFADAFETRLAADYKNESET